MTDETATTHVYRIVIKASAQAIWDAITKPEWTERYGYGARIDYDLKPGGQYRAMASREMTSMGMPEEIIVGEVIEADPPRRLVQTWHPVWDENVAAEKPTRLTFDIQQNDGGLCTVTITHDVTGAPVIGGMVKGGGDPVKGGGGWPWVLSDLKTLLETGQPLAA